jgi:hypothetical protein
MKPPLEVWQWLKLYGSEEEKLRFRPVYKYIQTLEERIKKLEGLIDEHNAPQFFPVKSKVTGEVEKQKLIQQSIENTAKITREKKVYTPLKDRLRSFIVEEKTDTPEWALTLKWNNLTDKEARELAGVED